MLYSKGQTVTLYSSFLTLEAKEPTTIADPKITIRHVDELNQVVTDVNEAIMVLADENTYYYKWAIASSAFVGEYNVEYQATVDGEYSESNVTVQVE